MKLKQKLMIKPARMCEVVVTTAKTSHFKTITSLKKAQLASADHLHNHYFA